MIELLCDCGSDNTFVVDKRGNWRRRECRQCGHRWSTYEHRARFSRYPMHRPAPKGQQCFAF
jgi:transcriptional regulator NrdR family protein